MFQEGIASGTETWSANGLNVGTEYTISTQTNDTGGNTNTTWVNHSATTADLPPLSITALINTTYNENDVTVTWSDPPDADFGTVLIYFDDVYQEAVNDGIETWTKAGLNVGTTYIIGTHTRDDGGHINNTWANLSFTTADLQPGDITGLINTTFAPTSIMWIWNDPLDADLSKVMVYFENVWQENVTAGTETWAKAGLVELTAYEIEVRSVDLHEHVGNWTNHTAWTSPPAPPAPPAAAFTANHTVGNSPFTVQFTDLSTGVPTSWSWDLNGNGVADSTLQNPVHTYGAGIYTVSLTATSASGSTTHTKVGYIAVGLVYTPTPTTTIVPINTSAASPIDFLNGTYTKYWINTTSGGIDMFGFGYALVLPFVNLMGYWWFGYIYFLYLGAVWFRGQRVSLPLTIGFLVAATWGVLFPPEMQYVATIIFALAMVGVMMRYLLSRWS